MPRNDRPFLSLYKKLCSLDYEFEWKEHTDNIQINEILSRSSKKNNDNVGYPDFIYVNEIKKILILVELKTSLSQHEKRLSHRYSII